MVEERRRDPRIKVNLPVRWESFLTQQEATVIDLSRAGCFVLSGGKVEPDELIRLEITLPNDEPVYPWAEVTQASEDIGFAVRFTSMEDDERERLEHFVRQMLAAQALSHL
jgi:hypothetical protein